jgi:hypothetical protein
VTIPTYPYEDALVPPQPWRIGFADFYPMWRLREGVVGKTPVPRDYETVVMENRWLRVIILPEHAGRIYRVIDKGTGKDLFYVNPVFKPVTYGPRFFWFVTGGIEFNAHGNEAWSARWEIRDGTGVVHLTGIERDGAARMSVDVLLPPDAGALSITTRLLNPYPYPINNTYMMNYMFATTPRTEMILPCTQVISHGGTATFSFGGTWPDRGQRFAWPRLRGKDVRFYENWPDTCGVYQDDMTENFSGLYHHETGVGFARVFSLQAMPGVEYFTFGNHAREKLYQPDNYTTDGSVYGEIMCHLEKFPDYRHYPQLAPYASMEFTDIVYPISGLGGLRYADARLAYHVHITADDGTATQAELRIKGVRRQEKVKLQLVDARQRILSEHTMTLDPTRPVVIPFSAADDVNPLRVHIRQGDELLVDRPIDLVLVKEGRW